MDERVLRLLQDILDELRIIRATLDEHQRDAYRYSRGTWHVADCLKYADITLKRGREHLAALAGEEGVE